MKRAMILIIFIFLISSVGCRSNKGCVSEDTAVSEITDAEKISADTVDPCIEKEPPAASPQGSFLGCEWTQRPSPHRTHPKKFPQTGEASCVCTELAVRSI